MTTRHIPLFAILLLAAGLLLGAGPAWAQTAPDFEVPIVVSDGDNSFELTIGMNAGASDGSDASDTSAPPFPPAPDIFDARIEGPGTGFKKDIRAATVDPITFSLLYRPEVGEGPITLSWDQLDFPGTVQATIVETGQSMNGTSSLDTSTDSDLAEGLTIEVDVVTPPAAPSGLDAQASSGSQIDLNWTDNADDEANVEVETATSSSGPFSALATLGANTTTYAHTGLALNSEHCYRVRAANVAGASAWSSVACATTPAGELAFDPSQTAFSVQEGGSDQAGVTVTASPSSPSSVSLSADAAWLGVPASVQAGASFTVTADAATLSEGTYTGTVTGSASDFSDATLTVELTVAPNLVTDFVGELTVTDDNGTFKTLTYGTSPEATDGVDAFYDQKAPPMPPGGAFDARLLGPTANLYTDFRATNTGEVVWTVRFAPADGGAPITLDWDETALPADGRFVLIGSGVEVDMRSQNSYTVTDLTINELDLVYSLTSLVDLSAGDGWNLVGLPLDAPDKNYQTLFSPFDLQQEPYWYDGTYVLESTLAMGKGYWLDVQSAGTHPFEGYEVGEMTLALNEGWNLIAGPSCAVPLASVADPDGVIDPSTLYAFDQVYAQSQSVEQGRGYWVEASAAADVTMSCSAAERTRPAATAAAAAGHALLTFRTATGTSQTLRIGPAVQGRSYALPPLPPGGAFDVRFDDDTRLLSANEGRIQVRGAQLPLTVALAQPQADAGEASYRIEALVDDAPVAEYRLAEAGDRFEVHDPAVTALRVSVQSGAFSPATFALRGNFPNPFAQSTRLVFDLPDNATVTMEVYDMLGRLLLVREEQMAAGAGRGLQLSGTSFPSGSYYYRLRAEMKDATTVKTGRFSVVR